jgi:hypothetical protein
MKPVRWLAYSIAVGSLLAAALAELWLRATGFEPWLRSRPGAHETEPPRPTDLTEPDAELGWVVGRGKRIHHRDPFNGIDVLYVGNGQGFRGARAPTGRASAGGDRIVLVFGDSIAFGFGVREEDRFSERLERALAPGVAVYNLAVPGWGLDQMYLAARRLLPELRPDLAVFAYIQDDLYRSLEAWRPFERAGKPSFEVVGGALVPRLPESGEPRSTALLRASRVLNFLNYHTLRHVEAGRLNRAIASEIAAVGRETGTLLLFVKIAERRHLDAVSGLAGLRAVVSGWLRRVADVGPVLRAEGIASLDLEEPMRAALRDGRPLFFPDDPHPDAEGHAFLAEAIAPAARRALASGDSRR